MRWGLVVLLVVACSRDRSASDRKASVGPTDAGRPPERRIQQLALNHRDGCSLRGNGEVWCARAPHQPPTRVLGVSDAVEIAIGDLHGCARRRDGHVLCWSTFSIPDGGWPAGEMEGVDDARAIAAGYNAHCVIGGAGTVLCAGTNTAIVPDGRRALGNPVVMPGISGATAIASSNVHVCVIVESGRVLCWGAGLGRDVITTPEAVAGVLGAKAIAAGDGYACAIVRTTTQCWGKAFGSMVPTPLNDLAEATKLVGGIDSVCGMFADGSARCVSTDAGWGYRRTLAAAGVRLVAPGHEGVCTVGKDEAVHCEEKVDKVMEQL